MTIKSLFHIHSVYINGVVGISFRETTVQMGEDIKKFPYGKSILFFGNQKDSDEFARIVNKDYSCFITVKNYSTSSRAGTNIRNKSMRIRTPRYCNHVVHKLIAPTSDYLQIIGSAFFWLQRNWNGNSAAKTFSFKTYHEFVEETVDIRKELEEEMFENPSAPSLSPITTCCDSLDLSHFSDPALTETPRYRNKFDFSPSSIIPTPKREKISDLLQERKQLKAEKEKLRITEKIKKLQN